MLLFPVRILKTCLTTTAPVSWKQAFSCAPSQPAYLFIWFTSFYVPSNLIIAPSFLCYNLLHFSLIFLFVTSNIHSIFINVNYFLSKTSNFFIYSHFLYDFLTYILYFSKCNKWHFVTFLIYVDTAFFISKL